MNSELWYEVVTASTKLTQGDLVFDCPLLTWSSALLPAPSSAEETETVRQASQVFRADVVVMTQACDLEHNKVRHVVLCPHVPLSKFRGKWEQAMRKIGQNPTAKAWANTCNDIAEGHSWNQAFLKGFDGMEPRMEVRVVDFHEVFTIPREFLEALLASRNIPHLRLLPPYREHLSQAFARFFMRVGLPISIPKAW